ncbi:MAG: helix-hairpin-helix domain-containing protein [Actinomycetota bacterium]|nr:helix-hairpin-helix domain-containing protein [Actinomycetota bacterium]
MGRTGRELEPRRAKWPWISAKREAGASLRGVASDAQRRRAERQQALAIAAKHPSLAREIGIGRPDKEDAFDADLVDVNNAPAAVLAGLPGLGEELASRIEEVRTQIGGFASLEDLGATLDLPGDLVEALRDQVVFLPRSTP